ncbi:hypothetical protein Tco_1242218 [Tanacetum coccineum]
MTAMPKRKVRREKASKGLILYDTKDLLEEYFNRHYGEDGTDISKKETEYHIEYRSGVVNRSFDSKREHSSMVPSPDGEKSSRVPCVVYHALNAKSYINVWKKYKLQ